MNLFVKFSPLCSRRRQVAAGGARLNFAVLFTWQLPGTPGFQFELLQNCFKWPRNKQQQSKIAHDSIKMIG